MELKQFLNLLDKDIETNPQNIKPITESLAGQLRDLVGSIEIDLDAPLVDEEDPNGCLED
jgi:antitoxin PrlF